jgi:muramidase (phage lysozyme)
MSAKKEAIKEVIASKESGGDYEVVFGGKKIPLTQMTIGEVIAWQKEQAESGATSTAAGKYQIILKTMQDLARRNPKDFGEDRLFDEKAQEWAADTLLNRRGWDKFESGKITDEQMALALAKEWASLPDPNTGKSYYAKDGVNKSHHTPEHILSVLNLVDASGPKIIEKGRAA